MCIHSFSSRIYQPKQLSCAPPQGDLGPHTSLVPSDQRKPLRRMHEPPHKQGCPPGGRRCLDLPEPKVLSILTAGARALGASQHVVQLCDQSSARGLVKKAHSRVLPGCKSENLQSCSQFPLLHPALCIHGWRPREGELLCIFPFPGILPQEESGASQGLGRPREGSCPADGER